MNQDIPQQLSMGRVYCVYVCVVYVCVVGGAGSDFQKHGSHKKGRER